MFFETIDWKWRDQDLRVHCFHLVRYTIDQLTLLSMNFFSECINFLEIKMLIPKFLAVENDVNADSVIISIVLQGTGGLI